jgi:transmembrane sensor
MSPNDHGPTTEAAAEAAARWFVLLREEAATGDDWLAFERWLAASPAHTAAYERVEQLWVDLDELDPRILDSGLNQPVELAQARRRRAGMSRRGWLAAGIGLAASVAAGVFVLNDPLAAPAETYRTAAGQIRQVALSDGTRIQLNAASSLQVVLRRGAREVQMGEGEAVFDVAHDPKRPFLIAVGDRQVRVVGTEFNLRHRDGRIDLTLRRGVVEVRPAGHPDAVATRLFEGQRLTHRVGQPVSNLSASEPDAAFAWTQGQLIYRNAPLSEVAADLSRSLAMPIRTADAGTGELRFSGVLAVDRPEAVMRRLEGYAPVRADRAGEGFVLRKTVKARARAGVSPL